jgi:hypothetical protein
MKKLQYLKNASSARLKATASATARLRVDRDPEQVIGDGGAGQQEAVAPVPETVEHVAQRNQHDLRRPVAQHAE